MKHYATLIACITGAALSAVERQWFVLAVLACVGAAQLPGLVREARAMDEQEREDEE